MAGEERRQRVWEREWDNMEDARTILLAAVNAKYIHSNPAIYYLRAYALAQAGEEWGQAIRLAEFTINQETDAILREIYLQKPDVLAFSCYIWNITKIEELVREVGKLLPDTELWLGGPEVSYDPEERLAAEPALAGIMVGEGEETFRELAAFYLEGERALDQIHGIVYNSARAWRDPARAACDAAPVIRRNPPRDYLDFNTVPFPYPDLDGMEHRIIYYETSRGCPFACSYCLSSVDRRVRLRDMGKVREELQFFLGRRVPQVKFVDRTFNCSPAHTGAILEYIREHDNGVTNFHFEIAAELLREEEIDLLCSLRPGQVQLEIGVQTVNPGTLDSICRKADTQKLARIVARLVGAGNMHIHLDLIAGLPYEDLASFRTSFQAVYGMRPGQLQLGFLKVLKGSPMERDCGRYGIAYKDKPPYEVLYTDWLSYRDILELKQVEEMLEIYHNSGQFCQTVRFLEHYYGNPYDLYLELARHWEQEGWAGKKHSRQDRYAFLRAFVEERFPDEVQAVTALLLHDLYARENLKSRPPYAPSSGIGRREYREFFEKKEYLRYLDGYGDCSPAQVARLVHLERAAIDPFRSAQEGKGVAWNGYLLYDYRKMNAVTHNACCILISEEELGKETKEGYFSQRGNIL